MPWTGDVRAEAGAVNVPARRQAARLGASSGTFPRPRTGIFMFLLRSPGRRIGYKELKNQTMTQAMNQTILTSKGLDLSLGAALAAFAVAVLALLVTIVVLAVRASRRYAREHAQVAVE